MMLRINWKSVECLPPDGKPYRLADGSIGKHTGNHESHGYRMGPTLEVYLENGKRFRRFLERNGKWSRNYRFI